MDKFNPKIMESNENTLDDYVDIDSFAKWLTKDSKILLSMKTAELIADSSYEFNADDENRDNAEKNSETGIVESSSEYKRIVDTVVAQLTYMFDKKKKCLIPNLETCQDGKYFGVIKQAFKNYLNDLVRKVSPKAKFIHNLKNLMSNLNGKQTKYGMFLRPVINNVVSYAFNDLVDINAEMPPYHKLIRSTEDKLAASYLYYKKRVEEEGSSAINVPIINFTSFLFLTYPEFNDETLDDGRATSPSQSSEDGFGESNPDVSQDDSEIDTDVNLSSGHIENDLIRRIDLSKGGVYYELATSLVNEWCCSDKKRFKWFPKILYLEMVEGLNTVEIAKEMKYAVASANNHLKEAKFELKERMDSLRVVEFGVKRDNDEIELSTVKVMLVGDVEKLVKNTKETKDIIIKIKVLRDHEKRIFLRGILDFGKSQLDAVNTK